MARDPLWMEGDDIALDDDLELDEEEDDYDGIDPDRLHDGFFDD